MISQFSREGEHKTLADLDFKFPSDVYPVGRLDTDSEGLLLLTNNKKLNHRLLNPAFQHKRVYLVQVEGLATEEACKKIAQGVVISVDGKKYTTEKCSARIADEPVGIPERVPSIRFRKTIPTSWIELTLTEGKNRQVRKMTAAAGFPTLRLIRTHIEEISLNDMLPGEAREMKESEVMQLLQLR